MPDNASMNSIGVSLYIVHIASLFDNFIKSADNVTVSLSD